MQPPQLLPEKTLYRVQRIGRLHGGCVLYVAGVFALLGAVNGDALGAIVGLAVAGAGAIEHHGGMMITHRDPRGLGWLIASQVCLFASIATYCAIRLAHLELPPIPDEIRAMVEANAALAGVSAEDFVALGYRLTLKLVLVLSVFYQGGMGLYYFTKRRAIAQALSPE